MIIEDVLIEGRKEALVKLGNTQEVDEYLEKFSLLLIKLSYFINKYNCN